MTEQKDDFVVTSGGGPSDAPAAAVVAEPAAAPAADSPAPESPVAEPTPAPAAATPAEPAAPAAPAAPKPKDGAVPPAAQQRIDQALGRQRVAEATAKAEKDRADALAREVEGLKAGKPAEPTPAAPAPAPAAAPADKPLSWDDLKGLPDAPKQEDFANYEDFTGAQTVFITNTNNARQAAADRARVERETAARANQAILAAHGTRLEAARKAHADFDAVTSKDLELSAPMEAAILHSDLGGELVYFLGQHEDVAQEIFALQPGPALVRMGEIQAQVRAAVATSGPAPAAAPVTQAPEPISPVGSAPTASTVPLDKMDPDEYVERRTKELAAARGR